MPEMNVPGMTAGELLKNTAAAFENAGIAEAGSDAWLLFENALSMDRTAFLMNRDEKPDAGRIGVLNGYIKERLSGRPVQYILNEAWFCGNRFHVTPDVLIPRFDTETLVEETAKVLKPGMKVLDLCTGSGCVIIALAKICPIEGVGSDISDAALLVAERNNKDLQAGCTFIKSDIYENIRGEYDIIVSNPPYIRTGDICGLQKEVKDFEPRLALDGGNDGLDIYRKIIRGAHAHLKENGSVLLEIGFDQAEDVAKILEENGFPDACIYRDLAGNDRVIKAVMRSSYV